MSLFFGLLRPALVVRPGGLRLQYGWSSVDLPAGGIEQVRSVRTFDERGHALRIEVWMRDGGRFALRMGDDVRRFGLGHVRRALGVRTRYFVEDVNGLDELRADYYESPAWTG